MRLAGSEGLVSPVDFLSLAVRMAWGTITYLLAYRAVPIAAVASSIALILLVRPERWLSWARGQSRIRQLAGATILGFTRPTTRGEVEKYLRLVASRPLAAVVYLAVSHNLTIYYLLLLGPLLGKDVLLSHVIGGVAFMLVAVPLVGRVVIEPGDAGREPPPRSDSCSTETCGELVRFTGLLLYGSLLGGTIAAWGLSPWAFAPAKIARSSPISQLLNAVLGGIVSVALWMWPVANLFVGTYLWKTGLAHAGLVAFFYASTVSPQRLRLYAKVMARPSAARFAAALATASVVAGFVTAIVYRVFGLTIHYKLIPKQLL